MTSELNGKSALVMGGSRGIGAAIVRRLAGDGAFVAFTYAASGEKAEALVAEIEAGGGKALAIKADSGDPAAVRSAIETAASRFGHLDILVNNAGILVPGLVDTYDLDQFDRMVAVNIRGFFASVQAVLPHMGEGGRIINIGSITADRSGFAGSSVYSMTKGAVAALTRGLARDLGPRGITVNNVQPGPTETDINDYEDQRNYLPKLMALGRMGKDHEVASFVAYLAGAGSSFMTGASLNIDGGYTA